MISYVVGKGRRRDRLFVDGAVGRGLALVFQSVPGVSYNNEHISMPANPRLYEYVVDNYPDEVVAESAQAWYAMVVAEESIGLDILRKDDAVIEHEHAETLYPFQRVGVNFMTTVNRTILADDMGLGKTVQTIAAVDLRCGSGKTLVVCPNAIKEQWQSEIARWSQNDFPVTVFNWPTREKQWAEYKKAERGWLIVNYFALQRFLRSYSKQSRFADIQWDWVVLDEAHRVKNRKTAGAQAATSLSARRMALLTGTPMGNDPSELWMLLHLIAPRKFSSFWRFYELYVNYVENFFGGRTILGIKNSRMLRRVLAPVMVMRKKEDVYPQLPAKQYQTIQLAMLPKQRKSYVEMLETARMKLNSGDDLTAWSKLAVLVRLRQILSTPANFDLDDVSCKLDMVMELLGNTKRRVLVYSVYRRTVLALGRRLDAAGITYTTIMGGMEAEDRRKAQEDLNGGKARVLLATIKAGGTGLNLQGASTAIFVDCEWNPIEQQQAEDRIHRIGQTKSVHIIRLVCPGTADDVVERVLTHKESMQDAVFEKALLQEFERYLPPAAALE